MFANSLFKRVHGCFLSHITAENPSFERVGMFFSQKIPTLKGCQINPKPEHFFLMLFHILIWCYFPQISHLDKYALFITYWKILICRFLCSLARFLHKQYLNKVQKIQKMQKIAGRFKFPIEAGFKNWVCLIGTALKIWINTSWYDDTKKTGLFF